MFDSRFEMVVLEGGGQGGRHYLDRTRITLGRLDAGDDPEPGTLAFPDGTVSRVHAVLEWDPKKHRYVLEHRSRTNATVINGTQVVGSQVLESGDRIKLGSLVLQIQAVSPRESARVDDTPEPLESGLYLVELPSGEIHPLNYTRLLLSRPPEEPTSRPGVWVEGAAEVRALLAWDGSRFVVKPVSPGAPPVLLRGGDGAVLEAVVPPDGLPLDESCLLLAGATALALAPVATAGELREHPLLAGARPGAEPSWQGGEEHVLRVLSGPARGTRLWFRGPVVIGPPDGDLPLAEKRPPRLQLRLPDLLNADETVSFTHNWETVTPGEEVRLVSGDRLTVGRTVVSFEHLPTQAVLDSVSVFHEETELPLVRVKGDVGYNPQNELRLDDRRLGPTHGTLELRDGRFFYRHKDAASRVLVAGVDVGPGEEAEVKVGDEIALLPDLVVRLGPRVTTGRPGDHVLIGPTQEEIEAAREG